MYTNYSQKLIKRADQTIIDTNALLNSIRLDNFISLNKEIFIANQKKILVPDCVMAELTKHTCSDDKLRRIASLKALDTLRKNKDLFDFDNEYVLPEGEENFADPKILKYLLENRRNTSQLLISNDQGLTSDAFNFNKMESFYGNKIHVCYLAYSGKLHMCDCVKENKEETKEIIKTVVVDKVKVIKEEKKAIEKYGIPALCFLGGLIVQPLAKYTQKFI